MTEGILIALISVLGGLITASITNKQGYNKIAAQLDKHQAVQDEKIAELTRQVEKHNGVVERVYVLERKVAVLEATSGGSSDKE